MTEIRIPIPELEQVLKNQEKIMQMLSKLIEAPASAKYDYDQLMTAPEVMHYLKCGRKKLKELVTQGKIQLIDAFGVRPRYKIVKHDAA